MTLGTAIVPVYNRTPAVLAMSAATLAELSQGRFVLGLGSSSHAIIEDWNGVPFELPLTRLRETVTVVRQALAGGKTDFEGKTAALARLPARQPARARRCRSTWRRCARRCSRSPARSATA